MRKIITPKAVTALINVCGKNTNYRKASMMLLDENIGNDKQGILDFVELNKVPGASTEDIELIHKYIEQVEQEQLNIIELNNAV